eukprot:TRINITY_DN12986_c0_g1_i1.p2 TRINITY_DN12986_c0_g1~~TRINITY_DN12986_c0_g1_i1.p2  ORF type:complete len:319 (-),score=54.65 TRINITY_DN12986_c0_g1_i1:1214-2170(-)
MPRILVLTTYGTYNQRVSSDGSVNTRDSAADIVQKAKRLLECNYELCIIPLLKPSGAETTFDMLLQLRSCITEAYDGCVVVSGTDSLEELAFVFDRMPRLPIGLVCTGAGRPLGLTPYDGIANIRDAILVAAAPCAPQLGVLLVFSEQIHAARFVRKNHSAVPAQMFTSYPGIVGEMRRNKPYFFFESLLPHPRTFSLSSSMRIPRVFIITVGIDTTGVDALEAFVRTQNGVVLAGMGTGSLPQSLIAMKQRLPAHIAVAIVTRCTSGVNYDDYCYRGSLDKYEAVGFRVREYEGFSAIQARLMLMMELMEQSLRAAL